MRQQLSLLREFLEHIDSNPIESMKYFTSATPTTTPQNAPPAKARELLIMDSLHRIQHFIMQSNDCQIVDDTIRDVREFLDSKYSNYQHLCWRSHEHHFHTDFLQYVNCPVTCLAEISEFLEKLQKELYHA